MLNHESPFADRVFHALADANRRAIIERLTREPATVSELARLLDVTVAATVQHLQVLQASELVRSEKAGRVRTCQIDPSGLRQAEEWLRRQRTTWEHRLDRLGEVLAETVVEHTSTPDDPAKERSIPAGSSGRTVGLRKLGTSMAIPISARTTTGTLTRKTEPHQK
jgi:DNA-binding transcriptional ArsR family regulator